MRSITQYLFESSATPVNILVGRFQPFTLGHLKCAEKIWKQYKRPTVLCMVETTKIDEQHPFLTSLIWKTYQKLVKKHECLCDIIKVKNADIIKISEELGRRGYTVVSWTCGTDRFITYSKWVPKYAPNVELIEIERDDKDVSATEVRQAIKADHEDRFKELVPEEIYSLYPKLKEAMNTL